MNHIGLFAEWKWQFSYIQFYLAFVDTVCMILKSPTVWGNIFSLTIDIIRALFSMNLLIKQGLVTTSAHSLGKTIVLVLNPLFAY